MAINRDIRLDSQKDKTETPVSKKSILNSELLEYLNEGIDDVQNRVFSQDVSNGSKYSNSMHEELKSGKVESVFVKNLQKAPINDKLANYDLKSSIINKPRSVENPEESEIEPK